MGDVELRKIAVPPLVLLPQPITFKTVAVKLPGAPPVSLINNCRNPTTLTVGGVGAVASVSIMGKVATDLLVVTNWPESGPLPAVIRAGPVPAFRSSAIIP